MIKKMLIVWLCLSASAIAQTKVPDSAVLQWIGNHASIPGGYTRDTAFDDRYLQGDSDGSSPGSNGGSSSHDHTADAHSHKDTHTHNFNINGAASGTIAVSTGFSGCATAGHTHAATRGSQTDHQDLSNEVIDINTSTMHPLHITAIPLQPSDSNQQLPPGTIIYGISSSHWPGSVIPANGSAGTVDMRDRFLKCATTGSDGGDSGGAATHYHTTASHSHDDIKHSHADFSNAAGATSLNSTTAAEFPTGFNTGGHHRITDISEVTISWSSESPDTDEAANDPPYIKLLAYQVSGNSSIDVYDGMILAIDSSAIPDDWILCDGSSGTPDLRDVQIKGTLTPSDVFRSGGTATHTHHTLPHTHQGTNHTHTYTFSNSTSTTRYAIGATNRASSTHTHTSTSMDSTTPVSGNADINTMSEVDGRQLYRTVNWIMYRDPNIPHVTIEGGTIEGAIFGN